MTLADIDRLGALNEAERTFQMDEESFRAFYDLTARRVWAYLARATGDRRLADDLLQETYYRFLRVRQTFHSDDHRRHYLFRIATNLVNDHRRQAESPAAEIPEGYAAAADAGTSERVTARIDLARAMGRLKPRERSMLWLAYAQGWSHAEIAAALELKPGSLKALLHRARRRLVSLLADAGQPRGRT
jgi:RNA polymerase sigma-70 factor, ECF subfamily